MTRVMFSWVAELCAAIVISTLSSLELHAQSFVYTNNQSVPNTVSAFSIAANGSLAPVPGSPFPTGGDGTRSSGNDPVTAGNYLYVPNNASGSISGFSINPTTGVLTSVPGSPFSTAESGNTLTATPDGKYLIALGRSVNGTVYSIGANGVLTAVAGSPYALGGSAGKITPDGKFLLVAHFRQVAVFSISPAGILSEVPGSPFILKPQRLSQQSNFTGAIDVDCSGRFGYFSSTVGLPSPVGQIDVISIAADGSLAATTGGVTFNPRVTDNDLLLSPDDKTLFASLTGGFTVRMVSDHLTLPPMAVCRSRQTTYRLIVTGSARWQRIEQATFFTWPALHSLHPLHRWRKSYTASVSRAVGR